jgi:hypothetical protein
MPARRGSGGEWLRFGVGEPFGVSDFGPSLRRDSMHFSRPAAYFRSASALLILLVRWTFSFVGPQTVLPAKPMTSPLPVADVALKAVGFTYVWLYECALTQQSAPSFTSPSQPAEL